MRRAAVLGASALACMLAGAVAFAVTDHVSFWLACYFSVTTAATVGYGDVLPRTAAAHAVALGLMVTALPLLGAMFASLTALHVRRHVGRRLDEHAEQVRAHVDRALAGHRSTHDEGGRGQVTLTMYDSAFNSEFPADPQAVAGYVDGGVGDQPNAAWLVQAFPRAHHLSIALFPDRDADCLDVESGAAQAPDIPAWYARQRARGIARPVIYAGAYTMQTAVVPVVQALPGARASVRLWTAHYGVGEHICGPGSCGALSIDADGTQWTSSAMGRVLDQSLLAADFFGSPAPGPAPAWQEAAVQALPVVSEGSTDTQAVRTVQGLLCARGHAVTVDGNFGPATLAALRAFQQARGLAADGKCGPATYPALLGVA